MFRETRSGNSALHSNSVWLPKTLLSSCSASGQSSPVSSGRTSNAIRKSMTSTSSVLIQDKSSTFGTSQCQRHRAFQETKSENRAQLSNDHLSNRSRPCQSSSSRRMTTIVQQSSSSSSSVFSQDISSRSQRHRASQETKSKTLLCISRVYSLPTTICQLVLVLVNLRHLEECQE